MEIDASEIWSLSSRATQDQWCSGSSPQPYGAVKNGYNQKMKPSSLANGRHGIEMMFAFSYPQRSQCWAHITGLITEIKGRLQNTVIIREDDDTRAQINATRCRDRA